MSNISSLRAQCVKYSIVDGWKVYLSIKEIKARVIFPLVWHFFFSLVMNRDGKEGLVSLCILEVVFKCEALLF